MSDRRRAVLPLLAALVALLAGTGPGAAPAAGALVAEPDVLDFGSTGVGLSSHRATTIRNLGPEPVEIEELALHGEDPFPFDFASTSCEPGSVLALGATCTVNLAFAPTSLLPQLQEGLLAVLGSDDWDVPAVVELSGTPRRAIHRPLATTPRHLTFSLQRPATRTAIQSVTVSNPGDVTHSISSVETLTRSSLYRPPVPGEPSGVDPAAKSPAFHVEGTTCASALPPGGSCEVRIYFEPAQPAGFGVVRADLRITSTPQQAHWIGEHPRNGGVYLSGRVVEDPAVLADQLRARVGPRLRRLVASTARLVRGGPARPLLTREFHPSARGQIRLTLRARARGRALTLARMTGKVGQREVRRLRFRISKPGVRLLRSGQAVRVTAVGRFQAVEPRVAVVARKSVVLPPPKERRRKSR